MANITFFDLKKLIKAEIFKLNLKDSSNITKILFQNTKKSAKICQKNAFYSLSFVLSGRFGDSYRRAVDSVCIQETPR